LILQVGRRRRVAVCRYLLNIVDVETLDSSRKRRLTNYLERRKKELETKLSSVNQALQVVKRRAKKRKR
jgi:ABC-type molybdate transport system ATPase subunit